MPLQADDRRAKAVGLICCCRHGELGARQHECGGCGNDHVTLNACGDRHCPQCARQSRYLWHSNVLSWSLNCDYLHIVTTLPHVINDLVAANPGRLLRLLLDSTRECLLALTADRYHCTPGLILVLHTWGQRLNHHYHVHVVMTAGGLSFDKSQWVHIDQDEMESLAAEIARRFKQKFLKGLRKLLKAGRLRFPESLADQPAIDTMLATLEKKDWIANIGATPQKYRDRGQRRMSLGYVGKYVAGTAIGDGRLISDNAGIVTFRAFDYRTGQYLEIPMPGHRFVEAYSDHILPARMHRCRYAGIFAPQGRSPRLEHCRSLLGEPTAEQIAEASDESEPNPFAGDEDAQEDEGSYVPCPVCREKTRLRFAIDGPITCELLRVAATVMDMMRAGSTLTIIAAICVVARAQGKKRPVLRALLPGRIETHTDLIGTTETLVRDQLRREVQQRQEGDSTERGPPRGVA